MLSTFFKSLLFKNLFTFKGAVSLHGLFLAICFTLSFLCLSVTVHAQPEALPTQPIANAGIVNTAPELNKINQANQTLLTKNAKLEQDINTLQTQVNVLIAERNNQLFMYGALIAFVGVLVGFIAAWLMLGRKQGW